MTSDNPTAAEGLAAMRQVQDFIDNEPALEHNCPGADCAKCRRRLAAFQATSLAITALRRPIPAGDDLVEVVARAIHAVRFEDNDDPYDDERGMARAALTAIGPRAGEVERLRAMLVDDPNDVCAGVPEHLIDAGMAVQDQANADHRSYLAGETTDWDEGMLAAAIFKAMLRTALAHTPEAEQ